MKANSLSVVYVFNFDTTNNNKFSCIRRILTKKVEFFWAALNKLHRGRLKRGISLMIYALKILTIYQLNLNFENHIFNRTSAESCEKCATIRALPEERCVCIYMSAHYLKPLLTLWNCNFRFNIFVAQTSHRKKVEFSLTYSKTLPHTHPPTHT